MIPTVKDIANVPVDRLPPLVHVPPVTRPFDITVRPPGSKSLTNRALLLAALADGQSLLTGALADADDAQVMIRALRQLGAEIEVTPEVEPNGESCGNATIRVKGVAGRWKVKPGETVTLNLNNAGTATRFLTAAAVLQPPGGGGGESGGIVIDGNTRMRERPIGELVDALRSMGVQVEYTVRQGYPPVRVLPPAALDKVAPEVKFEVGQSSQFISAAMLIAGHLPNGLTLHLREPVTSLAYVQMTESVLFAAGLRSTACDQRKGCRSIRFRAHRMAGFTYRIRADESSEAFPLVAALLVPKSLLDMGLEWPYTPSSISSMDVFWDGVDGETVEQARRRMEDGYRRIVMEAPEPRLLPALYQLGLRGDASNVNSRKVTGPAAIDPVRVSLASIPDETMALAVAAAFASGPSEFRGLKTLRVKETDRIAALVTELAKVGVTVEPFAYTDDSRNSDEGIRITPSLGGVDCSPHAPRVEFDTYDDHRMAMSLALIGLRRPNVYIRDPGCVRKTYPTFWRDLAKVYG